MDNNAVVLNKRLAKIVGECASDPMMNSAMLALAERGDVSKQVAALAGIAMNPKAKAHLEARLDEMWAPKKPPKRMNAKEVIIGGGLHAAIYARARVMQGHPPPLVLEASERAGGSFAVSKNPSFYLNSRNRPGPLTLPLLDGALNVLPGSELQPAHLSNSEYQRNSDLAYVIRTLLAANAKVLTGVRVLEANAVRGRAVFVVGRGYVREGGGLRLSLGSGGFVYAERVILATGLGRPRTLGFQPDDKRILDFAQFMAKMDEPFPLREMGRVAVIGNGDSGKTVIEALMGMGPAGEQLSMAALDRPQKIDWYGVGASLKCQDFEQNARSRYKPIGRLLPFQGRVTQAPVKPQGPASVFGAGFDCCYVDERPYDHVIVCLGYEPLPLTGAEMTQAATAGGRLVGKQNEKGMYTIGPAANLDISVAELASSRAFEIAPENKTAIFRYADRTAALAASLP